MGKKATLYLLYNLLIFTTIFLCLLAAGGHAAGCVDPHRGGLFPLLGLTLPLLLAVNLALLVYWLVRRRIWFLFPLLALALNWGYMASMYRFGPAKQDAGVAQIRVATYNIHGFRAGRYDATVGQIAAFMQQRQVDIACLQEYDVSKKFGLDSVAAVFDFLPYVYHPVDARGISELVVFSRYPIGACGFFPFEDSDNSALWVDVDVDGRRLRIVSAHLQTTGVSSGRGQLYQQQQLGSVEGSVRTIGMMTDNMLLNAGIRAEQARIVRGVIDTTTCPLVVCGDFNDTPASFTYRTMKGDLNDGFRACGSGYGRTFTGMYGLLRIDYMFYNDLLAPVSYESPEAEFSDHLPVIMGFDFTGAS